MSKGARTREQVVEQAAALFNQHGYHGASINDVMLATGLKKGGIYRHFASKEELALAAFAFAVDKMRQRFSDALAGKTSPIQRLRAIVAVYARIPSDPPVPGGCPILNASVESDDGNPALRAEARRVLDGLRQLLCSILLEGEKLGQLRAGLNREAIADVLIAQLEGAVMLSRLYGTDTPMQHTVKHLDAWLTSLKRA